MERDLCLHQKAAATSQLMVASEFQDKLAAELEKIHWLKSHLHNEWKV